MDDTYFGPIYPEAPPFRDPDEDLQKIGITNTKIMVEPDWTETERGRLLLAAQKLRR